MIVKKVMKNKKVEHDVLHDPNDFAKSLFFQVTQNGKIIFDQLNTAVKDLSGNIVSGIGETYVFVDSAVQDDFQVRCFKHGDVEKQVGQTVCLHTAFIENNF